MTQPPAIRGETGEHTEGEEAMANPTVEEIVNDYLKANGYDGLYHTGAGCQCTAGGLALCAQISPSCQAGYLVMTQPEIGPDKPAEKDAE